MGFVIDNLSTLNSYDHALARAELGSLLDVHVDELDKPLQIGVAERLARSGSGERFADAAIAVDPFTITGAGRERYGHTLDRFLNERGTTAEALIVELVSQPRR